MKKILALTTVLTLTTLLTSASDVAALFEYRVSGGEVTLLGFDHSYSGDLTIPGQIGGYPVTIIGDMTFANCKHLTSVTIPDSVIKIYMYAFLGCESLVSVNIPDSVKFIGQSAFGLCESLASITIPAGVETIDGLLFVGCPSLTSILVHPDNPSFASMDGVLFNKDFTTLLECPEGYSGTYNTPQSVATIADEAFTGCEQLVAVTIPESVTAIPRGAFYSCTSLATISIPDSVTSIEPSAFSRCSALTSISIPPSVTSIGGSAFAGCSALASVNIPQGVEVIPLSTFSRCTALTSITIPNSVHTIGNSAFEYCSSLVSVSIPESVTTIEPATFANCSALTSITIPHGVTTIRYSAFAECSALTTINIPHSVTSIEYNNFQNCTSLASIEIPDSIAEISNALFWGCTSLTSVSLPAALSHIGALAFADCTSLTTLAIPPNITSIESNTFMGCTALSQLTIPDSVTSIGALAFQRCTSLTTLNIPANVSAIGEKPFNQCHSLLSIQVDPANQYYASLNGALFNKELSTLIALPAGTTGSYTIPDNVVKINDEALSHCQLLTTLIVPETITTLAYQSIAYCDSLTAVFFIGHTPYSVGARVFHNTPATLYYLPYTLGWGSTFADRPTAVWLLPLTLTLDPNGGTVSPTTLETTSGSYYNNLPTPDRNDYEFNGWWSDPESGERLSDQSVIATTNSHTIYAQWLTSPGSDDNNNGDNGDNNDNGNADSTSLLCDPAADTPFATSGSFDGFLYATAPFAGIDATAVRGTLSLKIKATAKATNITAKAMLQSGNFSFKNKGWTRELEDGTCQLTIATKKGETLDLYVRQNRIWGTIHGGKLNHEILTLAGNRNIFAEKGNPLATELNLKYKGYYTVALPQAANPISASSSLNTAPLGIGYLGITIGNKGKVKLAGMMADGTRLSRSTRLIPLPDCGNHLCIPLFAPLYSKKGWTGGLLWIDPSTRTITTERDLNWQIRWENPGRRPEAGFSELLDACGGFYDSRLSLNSLPTLYLHAANTATTFFDPLGSPHPWTAELNGIAITPFGTRLTYEKGKKPKFNKQTNEYDYHPANPTAATLSFKAKTGIFKGKYTLWAEYENKGKTTLKGVKTSYNGIMVPLRHPDFDLTTYPYGMGFSLTPELDPSLKSYKIRRSAPLWLTHSSDDH